ncbi:hypothetical protein ACIQ87_40240, partial [Kitasatospora sp. NPDC096204]
MLRITADVYSGRPNPVADITDTAQARTVLRELTRDRTLFTDPRSAEPPAGSLGLRGFWLETFDDELAHDFDVDSRLYLPAGPQAPAGRGAEVAERLVTVADWGRAPAALAGTTPPVDASFRLSCPEFRGVRDRVIKRSGGLSPVSSSAPVRTR